MIWQLGYVGTKGTHLLGLFDINPAALDTPVATLHHLPRGLQRCHAGNTGNNLQPRPYYSQFPNFSVIDEARSNLGSIYNSLQTTLRVQNCHSLTSQLAYTWGHALDYETGLLPYVAQNPFNEKAEYGNSDFDVRNTLTGYSRLPCSHFQRPERL